jgi:protein phosphatase 1 regulatory subunit 7
MAQEPVTYLQLGSDIELDPEAAELAVHYAHVAKIEHLDRMPNLKKLVFVATGVRRIENIEVCGSRLEHLEIYQANLTKMENLEVLTGLTVLDIAFNKIEKIENIEKLTKLQKLYLSANSIIEIENLDTLFDLKVLELGSNQIKEIKNIGHLLNLEELWLGKNRIRSFPIDPLVFNKVHTLSLQSNRIREWSAEFFKGFPTLKKLYLSNNALSDPDESVISSISESIEELDIACNKLTKIPDFAVKKFSNLKELWLNDNQISDFDCIERLRFLPSIETVYLERNPIQKDVPVEYVNRIRKACPSLTQLDAAPLRPLQVMSAPDPSQTRPILKTESSYDK